MTHRISIFKLILAFAISLLPCISIAQEPIDDNPDFRVQKVDIPYKKNKTIVGRLNDGRILVQCAKADKADGSGISRDFYWVWHDGTGEVKYELSNLGERGFLEMTSFENRTIFYTVQDKGEISFIRGELDDNDEIKPDRLVPIEWDGEINNPYVFQLATSDYPALLFSAPAKDRKDYDLFVSELINNKWTEPKPLDNKTINTEYNEQDPYVSKDGMLFFTTDRPAFGEGGSKGNNSNLWFALPDFNKYWKTAPVNELPPPFSTIANERQITTANKKLSAGFFTSQNENGWFDLMSFEKTDIDLPPVQPRYHALLIGVDDYMTLPKLKRPVADAMELKTILERYYNFQVDILRNPTRQEIIEQIKQYQYLLENEYLLIGFFGHGIKVEPTEEIKTRTCQLAGVDGKPDGTNCITPDYFLQILANYIDAPRHVLVILNACWSGYFKAQGMRGSEFDNKSRKVLASCKSSLVPDENGPFFHFLKEFLIKDPGLKQEEIIGDHIRQYIFNNMNVAEGNENEPMYFDLSPGSEGGHFPLPSQIKK